MQDLFTYRANPTAETIRQLDTRLTQISDGLRELADKLEQQARHYKENEANVSANKAIDKLGHIGGLLAKYTPQLAKDAAGLTYAIGLRRYE